MAVACVKQGSIPPSLLSRMRPLGLAHKFTRVSFFNGLSALLRNFFRSFRLAERPSSGPRTFRLIAAVPARNARFVSCVDEAKNRENERIRFANETKRFASGVQVIEIIEGAESTISRNRLFSMT